MSDGNSVCLLMDQLERFVRREEKEMGDMSGNFLASDV